MPRLKSPERSQPKLSIILPWLGDDRLFEDSLASILRNRPDDCEILIPHNGELTDEHGLAGEVVFLPQSNGRNLTALVNQAFEYSGGEIVHLLRPGVEVDEGWCERPIEILKGNSKIASTAPPILNACQPKQILVSGISCSKSCKRIMIGGDSKSSWRKMNKKVFGPSSWCAFYRREPLEQIFQAVGQFGDPDFCDATLDLDLALSLKGLGYQHQVTSDYSVSSECPIDEERFDQSGLDANRLRVRHRRYLAKPNVLTGLLEIMGDAVAAFGSRANTRYLIDRLTNRKELVADRNFAKCLSSARLSLYGQKSLELANVNRDTLSEALSEAA